MAGRGPQGTETNSETIDEQTLARTRHRPLVPLGKEASDSTLSDLAKGSEWRVIFLLEKSGTYREIYTEKAVELKGLQGKVPEAKLERMRGELKAKYQAKMPPEVDKTLRAIYGEKYDARTATGSHNPGKTSPKANLSGKIAKHSGRILIIFMVYSEYKKTKEAEDWTRQLGSSSSGFLGSVIGGTAGGAGTGLALGGTTLHPVTIMGATLIGGIIGGAIGYKLFSGGFEYLYDVYIAE
jgi:hypothetical protein